MSYDRAGHYLRRFIDVSRDVSVAEAGKRGVEIATLHALNRIFGIIHSNGLDLPLPGRLLYIESTNHKNGFGLGDGIFKTAMIRDIGMTPGLELDVITHRSRENVFRNNPNIRNLMAVQGLCELPSLTETLKARDYNGVMLIFPDTEMMIAALVLGWQKNIYYEKKRYDPLAQENSISMYREIAGRNIPNIAKGDGLTYLALSDDEIREAKALLDKRPGLTYVGINIGAKCSLRNFKNWEQVVEDLDSRFPGKIRFVLYGRENCLGIDERIVARFSNVTNLVGKTSTLRSLYAIVNEMDLNIGADGGNINASIALGRLSLPIYSVVEGVNRVPSEFPQDRIIQAECPRGKCILRTMGNTCVITKQRSEQHGLTPPCLSSPELARNISIRAADILSPLTSAV